VRKGQFLEDPLRGNDGWEGNEDCDVNDLISEEPQGSQRKQREPGMPDWVSGDEGQGVAVACVFVALTFSIAFVPLRRTLGIIARAALDQ
jgi:hypothetical protein